MIRSVLFAALISAPALPVLAADSKAQSCQYQAQVVAAIQQARLDRVKERGVPDAIAATNPAWPDNYNKAIPLMTPWVYEQKMKDIRTKDLSAAWLELCLKQ
ncbi:hypothetical protein [Primorskyibacter sp. S87]|uniref:hypothetical protein n=1 Tax=Primorskyibacter sp. S87 TaxID=3415126 RepID=UPI003C7A800E